MPDSPLTEIEKLEQAIAALQAQRALLGDAVVDAALAPLHDKLRSLRAASRPAAAPDQRRTMLTVLFADIPSLGAFTDRIDDEELSEVISALWKRLDAVVAEHQGQVDKHFSNGVMALWGAEIVSEDDPEQAIRAALAMRAAVEAFAQTSPQFSGLGLRVGINTGPAIVGAVGMTGEVTAMGDTVNLAARLQQSGAPGNILVSYDTYRNVRGVFDVLEQAPLTVKGKSEPVHTYLVRAAKPRAFRVGTRGVEGVETRMVGRDAELRVLQDQFWGMFKESRLQATTVVADAGLGKSRLVYEFSAWLEVQPADWFIFQGRATASTVNAPYAYLRDILAFRFEIQDSDPLVAAREKLERGFERFLLGDDRAREKAHFIGHLLGFDFSSSPHLRGVLGDPRQLRSQAVFYLTQFFIQITQQEAAILMLDDLHWADPASLDVLVQVISNLPSDARLLVMAVARPTLYERYAGWSQGWDFHTRIELMPLTREHSREVVEHILQKVQELPPALEEMIVGGAEGNPLYLEELIKMLIDGRVIVPGPDAWSVDVSRLTAASVPPTLNGILQARLDRLSPLERITLQRASVVGRVFWSRAVQALSGETSLLDEMLSEALGGLRAKELIFERASSAFLGMQEFIFKNALLRDVTYETVLKRQRAVYHAGAAEWLNSVSGERRSEYLPVIAEHYEKAGETVRASATLREAGDLALGLSAFPEAQTFFERALVLYPSLESTSEEVGQLELRLGETFFRAGDYPRAQTHAQSAMTIARRLGLPSLLAAALYQMGSIAADMGDYPRAESYLQEALTQSQDVADERFDVRARVLFGLGNVNWRLGNLESARRFCEQSRDMARTLNDMPTLLLALNRLGVVMGAMGNPQQEEALYEEVLSLAIQAGNRDRAAVALNNLGALADEHHQPAKARDYYLRAMTMAREIGARQSLALYLGNLGHCEIKLGDYSSALAHLREGLGLAHRLGAAPWALTAVLFFGQMFGDQGDHARALGLIGMCQAQPAFSADHRRLADEIISAWGLPSEVVAGGVAAGRSLPYEQVVRNLAL